MYMYIYTYMLLWEKRDTEHYKVEEAPECAHDSGDMCTEEVISTFPSLPTVELTECCTPAHSVQLTECCTPADSVTASMYKSTM